MGESDKVKAWNETFAIQKALTSSIEVKTVFDVGAYNGGTSLKYKEVFPTAVVYSFEPFPSSYRKALERIQGIQDIYFFQKAITDHTGKVEFFCNKSELTNSTLQSCHTGTGIDEYTSLEESFMVDSITIDQFCKSRQIEEIDILKLDIQGAELAALRGAESFLNRQKIKVLFLEVEFMEIYKKQPLFHDIASYLYAKGYQLYDFRGLNYTEKGQIAWGDAIFCSNEIVSNLGTE